MVLRSFSIVLLILSQIVPQMQFTCSALNWNCACVGKIVSDLIQRVSFFSKPQQGDSIYSSANGSEVIGWRTLTSPQCPFSLNSSRGQSSNARWSHWHWPHTQTDTELCACRQTRSGHTFCCTPHVFTSKQSECLLFIYAWWGCKAHSAWTEQLRPHRLRFRHQDGLTNSLMISFQSSEVNSCTTFRCTNPTQFLQFSSGFLQLW